MPVRCQVTLEIPDLGYYEVLQIFLTFKICVCVCVSLCGRFT